MTKTQAQILELFQTLPAEERRELANQLYATVNSGTFYDRMTPDQRAELDKSIAEADNNEGAPAESVFADLSKKFGFRWPA